MSQEQQQFNTMALPAMITGFGEQSANYGAAVGQSLAQLGQQVGQQLAMREYQRQASAALPAMQQSYDEAFSKMGTANYLDGYKQLLQTNLQYGSTQNPFLAQYVEQANQTAKQLESAMWRQAQYGGRGGAAGGAGMPAMGPSGAQTAMAAMYGQAPTGMDAGGMDAIMLPDEAEPIEGALPEGEVGEAESLVLTEGDVAPMQQPTQVQQDAANAFSQVMAASPSDQVRGTRSLIAGDKDKSIQWETQTIDNLSRFFPKVNISDEVAIAPIGSDVEYTEAWSGQTDKPGARFTGTKRIKIDDQMNKTAKEFTAKLRNGVNLLTTSGPEDSDEYWIDIIEAAGGIENIKPTRNPDDNSVSIKPRGKDPILVGAGQNADDIFAAISEVKGLSGFAQASGVKLLPENISGPGVRERKFGSVEEALASGLPAGTTVYILKDGKYKPARIQE
jgi:hypothetical protein